MLRHVLQWLYSACVWSVAIPSNNVRLSSASFEISNYALHWELQYYPCVNFVGLVFVSAIICVLCRAVPFGYVISSCVLSGKRQIFYGDGIKDAIFIQYDGIRRWGYQYKRS